MNKSNISIYNFIVAVLLAVSCTNSAVGQNQLKLWYDTPADASVADSPDGWKDDPDWLKALPLGNGSLGLMVFGDVNWERIQLNEESMWSGSPDDNDNPDAFAAQGKIRQLLFEGKYKEATELTDRTQIATRAGSGHGNGAGVPFGSFQTLGDLWIDSGKDSPYDIFRTCSRYILAVRSIYGTPLHWHERLKKSLDHRTSPNLFGLHPPFQMDANFGTTAGIAEMLLQSHAGVIELLPALPKAWPTGKVTGLRARGGLTIDMEWKNGQLTPTTLLADTTGNYKLKYGSYEKQVSLKAGEKLVINEFKK